MISTSDFRKGAKILFRNEPYMVIEYHSVKPGKGGAYVRTRMKNMITGLMHEELFRSGEKFPSPDLEYRQMQYLYQEGDNFYFMDQTLFEEVVLRASQLEDVDGLLKEQEIYTLLYFSGKPIAVTPPMFLELKVVDSPPGVRGDTAQGAATKQAKLETGLTLNVPLFVEEGDILKIDTRDSSYIERVKK